MRKKVEAVLSDLKTAGAQEDVIRAARQSLERNFPPGVYTVAVWFLGIATLTLIVGAIVALLLQLEKAPSDAMWTAIGAGIGALAGIFTAKSDA